MAAQRGRVDIRTEVCAAEQRIRKHIRETPLEHSPYLSRTGDCRVYLKLENLQLTGSFKLRGAVNRLATLSDAERKKGLVTASSGNHGAACAWAFRQFGCPGLIYLPETASPAKIAALRNLGAKLELRGQDCVEAEAAAREHADSNGLSYISPYNDAQVIGGQGTIAIELERQAEKIDAVLVPVGGGGLIAGIGGYLKTENSAIEIIGCQPENSAVMYESVRAGRLLDLKSKPTLSDGTAGGIEPGSITFDLCREYVDDYCLVSEEEIREAIRLILENHHLLVEGSAVLSVAALLKSTERFRGKTVVLLLSGARIGLDSLKEVLA